MICTLPTHIFPIQADDDVDGSGEGGNFVGSQPAFIPTTMAASCPINRGGLLKFDPHQSTEFGQVPHSQQ